MRFEWDGGNLSEYVDLAEVTVEEYEADAKRGVGNGLFWLDLGSAVEIGVGRCSFYSRDDPLEGDGWPISREKAKLLLALHFWLEENRLLGNM